MIRISTALISIVEQADRIGVEKPIITMPMWALNVLANEIQSDLNAPGSLFGRPYRGFKFIGISFEPSDLPIEAVA